MKAIRVHQFGGIEAMVYEEIPRPVPGKDQVLIHVKAAGVGPWDALIRSGGSKLGQPLPLTLGSDFAGVVEEVGPGVSGFRQGDELFGAANPLFIGTYAEYAVADAGMIALKPARLSFIEAASVPIVACTAWQMLFDHGKVDGAKRVLVQGAAGSVGAYAVQFAKRVGAEVIATAFIKDRDYLRLLGADTVIDVAKERFENGLTDVDVVIDTVGGETLDRSFAVLKPGGILVSVAGWPDQEKAARCGVQGVFFYVDVTAACLAKIAELLESGQIRSEVGEVLPLSDARSAHEMLAGRPHARGKIVLTVDG